MKKNNKKSIVMYAISRIDDEKYRTHAWRVSLCRYGKRHVKNFPDKTWGNKTTALKNAKAHRDQLLLKYPPITRKEFCNVKRRNNKTGITGVYKYVKTHTLRDGTVQENWYWEANWPNNEVGKSCCKSFSLKKYGDEVAKIMAIRARKQGLRKVEGTFWAAERGVVQTTKPLANLISTVKSLVNRVA